MTVPFHLRRIHGEGNASIYHVIDGARLGRAADNEIVVDEDGVSRRHCSFHCADDKLTVKDLQSTNGVFVNGKRVAESELAVGDLVLIGRITFVVGVASSLGADTQSVGSETIQVAFAAARSEYHALGLDAVRAEEHLAALARFVDVIPRAERADDLFGPALAALVESLRCGFGAVYQSGETQPIEVARKEVDPEYGLAPSRSILARVLESKEAVLAIIDGRGEAPSGAASLVSKPSCAILAAPILCGEEVHGALYLVGRNASAAGERELRLVSLVARTLALALESLRAQERVLAEVRLHRAASAEGVDIVAASPAMRSALDLAERAARSEATILLIGETGTGKEVLARAIHATSPRRLGPFVPINCGALPASMIESELFGHERGAFTGAVERRLGRFELADRGTLFLDEIGELPIEAQVKLLRVLEDKRFFRVGGQKEVRVDVRLVAATNRDLNAAVESGAFRADLLYRIRVVEVKLPPLRERMEDIVLLAESMLSRLGARRHRLSDAAKAALLAYPWPGNARELRNVLERACLLCDGERIGVDDLGLLSSTGSALRPNLRTSASPEPGTSAANPLRSMEEVEKEHIRMVLDSTGWNKVHAAEVLGIGRTNLYEKIRLFGLKPRE